MPATPTKILFLAGDHDSNIFLAIDARLDFSIAGSANAEGFLKLIPGIENFRVTFVQRSKKIYQ